MNTKMLTRPGMFLLLQIIFIKAAMTHGPIQVNPVVIDISTFPPIEQDIEALANYGNAARGTGGRLVERGYDALNYLHAALLDPAASFPQKMQLITVPWKISEGETVEHIQDVENALLTPMRCCGASHNTHVSVYTLYFFEAPRLALSQIESFSGVPA